MIRLVLAFLGLLFFGGVGAFFLFIPPLWIATALLATIILLLTGLVLLYRLGKPVTLADAED